MKLVLASNNAKKLGELAVLFEPLGLSLVSQASLGVAEAEEPHLTFVENALAKARHAAAATRLPAIADDSGLCVQALGGAPGVISAHYAATTLPIDASREAQRQIQDEANNRLLLQRLKESSDRSARFVSTLVAVRSADDPEPLIAFGRWPGQIIEQPSGSGGFGYDPLMYIPELGCTVAQLPADRKNAVSHRARAARQMLELMREAWELAPTAGAR